MNIEIDRRDICNMLAGISPSYEQMVRIETLGLGYYVGGFRDEWHWDKNSFKYFSDEELLQIYKSIRQEDGHRD